MIVKRSNVMGYCMGVRSAVDLVYREIESGAPEPIQTFGPIIHNRLVLEELQQLGVRIVEEPEDITGGTVIIRAHGIPPGARGKLESKAVRIVDGTCPRVLKSQRTVDEYSRKGWSILLAGDRNHGEIRAVAGYASKYEVIKSVEEAEKIDFTGNWLVISQTTLSVELFAEICEYLGRRGVRTEKVNSICPATGRRQAALKSLCVETDAVLIVGGKNSANTRALLDTAFRMEKPAWLIEDSGEIPVEIYDYGIVGLTAGASTPDWVIDGVEEQLLKY